MTSLIKNETKKFISLQTQRLAEFFEGLNSSLVHLVVELCLCKDKLLDLGYKSNRLQSC